MLLPKNDSLKPSDYLQKLGYNKQLEQIAITDIPPLRAPLSATIDWNTDKEYEALWNHLPGLFENPLIKKRIHLYGHGHSGKIDSIAALPISVFERNLKSLQQIGLEIILIDSCHGASQNMVKAFCRNKYPFYIAMASMGDLPTLCLVRQIHDCGYLTFKLVASNHLEFWNRLNQAMANQCPKKREIGFALKHVCGANFTSVPVLIKPNTSKAKALQFEHLGTTITPKFLERCPSREVICDKSFVALYPENVNLHLVLRPANGILPLIYSRIPDHHIHFISKISSPDKTYEQIITESLQYRVNIQLDIDSNIKYLEETNTRHFFFVKSIEDNDGVIIKNVLSGYFFEKWKAKNRLIYQLDNRWYLRTSEETIEISAEHAILEIMYEALTIKPSQDSLGFVNVKSMGSYLEHVKTHFQPILSENLVSLLNNPEIVDIPNFSTSEAAGVVKFAKSHPEYHHHMMKLIEAHPSIPIDHSLWEIAIEKLNFELIEIFEFRGYRFSKESDTDSLLEIACNMKSVKMVSNLVKDVDSISLKILRLIVVLFPLEECNCLMDNILNNPQIVINKTSDIFEGELSIVALSKLLADKNFSLLSALTCSPRYCFNLKLETYMYLDFKSADDVEKTIQIYFNSVFNRAESNSQAREIEFMKEVLDFLTTFIKCYKVDYWTRWDLTDFAIEKFSLIKSEETETFLNKLEELAVGGED